MKVPKFVLLIYEDHSVKGYNWVAFKNVMSVAASDYATRKLKDNKCDSVQKGVA